MEVDWPIRNKSVTYIIGSPRTIALFGKGSTNEKTFIKDLRKLNDVKIRKSVKFIADTSASNEFIYVVDYTGLQVVIQIEHEDDQQFDISKYDA